MFLNEFNQTSIGRVASLNKMLSEEFGIKINPGTVNLEKLMKINETAKVALYKIRGSKKKFQLEPEYAKYLGLKDISETMIVVFSIGIKVSFFVQYTKTQINHIPKFKLVLANSFDFSG